MDGRRGEFVYGENEDKQYIQEVQEQAQQVHALSYFWLRSYNVVYH